AQHLVTGAKTLLAVLFESLEQNRLELLREIRADAAWRDDGLRRADVVHRRRLGLAAERVLASRQRVKDDPERKDVGAAVESLAVDLLGRHVADLALHLPG